MTTLNEPQLNQPIAHAEYNMTYVWAVSLVAALGGLLFGYDWVVIGGAKLFYEKYFALNTPDQVAWAMSCALIGCLAGAVLSGSLSDRFGRKRLLMAAALLFVITSIGTGMAQTFIWFVAWRILGGVAIGLASNLSPMYIAELAPADRRGKLVAINQLTIVIGILTAQLVNHLIAQPVPPGASQAEILASWNGQFAWRWMFAGTALPAMAFLVLMFAVPESPRWLARNGQRKRALSILGRVGGAAYAEQALAEIDQTLSGQAERVDFRQLLEPAMLRILFIGVVLAVFQQWCGINVIFNYADEVFSAAGYQVSDIMLNIVITGAVSLVFTFVAIFTVDGWGRRRLMLGGAAGLGVTYALIALSYLYGSQGWHVLVLVMVAMACYSCSLAPIVWVVLSEIFPNRIRGAAMSISVFALWSGCFVLTYTFPHLNAGLGAAGTFAIYSVICVAGLLFVYWCLPETKGKTLEEIERQLVG